ncbi:MAG: hypothetical protein HN576_11960, partial [Bacteriovoracaceae bacterium]|nr:hypothetical protein [Bacteriovoracaceae bacterium]
MQVVIIDPDESNRTILSLYLDSGFGFDTLEYSDFSLFRDEFKKGISFQMLVITSDSEQYFLDLADCLYAMDSKIPVIIFRKKVLDAKILDQIEDLSLCLEIINLPFKEDDFFVIVEKIFNQIEKELPPDQEPNQAEEVADYSLKKERKPQQEEVADYSLKKETKPQQEGVADYSLKKETKPQ